MNLILNSWYNLSTFLSKFLCSFFFLKFNINFWDKANNFINKLITKEINEEYIIWGSWYIKLNLPLSSYILWIVYSLKNRVFIAKYKVKSKTEK